MYVGMYVGVDVGTSVTKAGVLDASGRVLGVRSLPTRLVTGPNGVAEQDVDEVVASVRTVVRGALDEAMGDSHRRVPEFLSITGQGDGLWLVDASARPVRPAISWLDGRAAGILDRWISDGLAEKIYRRNGNMLFPGSAAPLLAYLDQAAPHELEAADTAACCKDVVFTALTGVRATDVSDASLPFLDPRTRDYADDLLAACGLAHRRNLLAPIEPAGPCNALRPAAARKIGLPPGMPVVAAPFDLAACALGSGTTGIGDGLIIIGTTLATQVVANHVDTAGKPVGMHLAMWHPGRWLRAMPAMTGTAALDWVLSTLGLDLKDLDALLGDSPPGANGVTVLPFFALSGERAPFIEPHARAQFSGVNLATSKADLVRATCEAIAFAARHCLASAALTGELTICGGGVGSPAWLQLFADVLGRPLRIAAQPQVGIRGAVLAAADRLGVTLNAAEWTASHRVLEPQPQQAGAYDERYRAYLDHLAAARARWAARR